MKQAEKVINYLINHPLINVRGLENQAEIPIDTIRNALEGKRGLPEKHSGKILKILSHYGYSEVMIKDHCIIKKSLTLDERINRLVSLFKFDGRPYLLSYEYRKRHSPIKEDEEALNTLIKEGKVIISSKDKKTVTYRYIAED
jgi:hypothetical protein